MRLREHRLHQGRRQRVSGPLRFAPADDRRAQERKIANKVQRLVADKLIREAQAFLVQNPASIDHNAVFQRRSQSSALPLHGRPVSQISESARRSDLGQKDLWGEEQLEALRPDGGIVKDDAHRKFERFALGPGQERRAPIRLLQKNRLHDLDRLGRNGLIVKP